MVRPVEDRKGHDRRYSLDITKIRDELGYEPSVPFDRRAGRDRRLVPRQPGLVGAAEGTGRPRVSATVRWLVTGAGGMLGQDLVAALRGRSDASVTAADRERARHHRRRRRSPTRSPATRWWSTRPRGPTSTAPRTDEADATAVNGTGAEHLARACAAAGAVLAPRLHRLRLRRRRHRAVPRGRADRPGQRVRPQQTGRRAGRALDCCPDRGYVVRTAWLYGAGGRNFVSTMLRLAAERDTVDVVDDQTGPAHLVGGAGRAADRARRWPAWPVALRPASTTPRRRARPPGTGWPGRSSGWPASTRTGSGPRPRARFPRPAPRPAYSVLGHDGWARASMPPLTPWEQMLARALPTLMPPGGPTS